jgi:homoserine O-succinyltransferase/O-acetyltransferase
MPIDLEGIPSEGDSAEFLADPPGAFGDAPAVAGFEIALLNNMPDAALRSTERQFVRLLRAAAGPRKIRLHLFTLPEVARGEAVQPRLKSVYSPLPDIFRGRFDALIVTGTEPQAAALSDEPYWRNLADIVDWAEHNTISTIWSCLAAHAAALHLDGIKRQPFRTKCSGVFACESVGNDMLLDSLPSPLSMPHSRWNDLSEAELIEHGYRILARSAAGVDLFAKQWRSLFVFFQGHPEYAANSLMLEYRRDVGRFLNGERDSYPTLPIGYFDPASEMALAEFARRAQFGRHPALFASFPTNVGPSPTIANQWHASGAAIIRNWLNYVARQKS